MTERLGVYLLGAGGHGKVVASAAIAAGIRTLGILDDNPSKQGARILGAEVLGAIDEILERNDGSVVLGIGENAVRKR